MSTDTYIQQGWTIQQQALAEAQAAKLANQPKPKPHRPRKCYWITVVMPDQSIKDYQLSKDLQHACSRSSQVELNNYLINSVIVVPISKFYDHQNGHTYPDVTIGRIIRVFKRSHTSNPKLIARGQMVQPNYNWRDYPKYHQMFNYLKHDYDRASQERIHDALTKIVKPKYQATYWIVANALTLTVIIFSFLIDIWLIKYIPEHQLTTLLTTMGVNCILTILIQWPYFTNYYPNYKWTTKELESLSNY